MSAIAEQHQRASVERLSFIEKVLADAFENWLNDPSEANRVSLAAAQKVAEEVLAEWEEWNLA